jgi:hypothetical protein
MENATHLTMFFLLFLAPEQWILIESTQLVQGPPEVVLLMQEVFSQVSMFLHWILIESTKLVHGPPEVVLLMQEEKELVLQMPQKQMD